MSDDLLPWATQRQVLETQAFTKQLAELGDIQRLDEAIGAVQLILTNNAEVFPVVTGFERTRLAKTVQVEQVPPLNIWFMIDDSTRSVILLYIELAPLPE